MACNGLNKNSRLLVQGLQKYNYPIYHQKNNDERFLNVGNYLKVDGKEFKTSPIF